MVSGGFQEFPNMHLWMSVSPSQFVENCKPLAFTALKILFWWHPVVNQRFLQVKFSRSCYPIKVVEVFISSRLADMKTKVRSKHLNKQCDFTWIAGKLKALYAFAIPSKHPRVTLKRHTNICIRMNFC